MATPRESQRLMSPGTEHTQLPPIPPSRAGSFASTAFNPAASLNLPAPPPPPLPRHFLSRNDITASITAYETLSEAAKAYRKALATVATTASAFGAALETCARCKGAGDTADGLMNAGGLQYLIASNMHILSESLYRGFEVPLLHEVDSYKEKTAENEDRYKKQANEKSKDLRKREQDHLKLARQKRRNLTAFRSALVDLTTRIDELENMKYAHYRAALDLAQETSAHVLDSSALAVRAEIEIFEKVAQKGWDSSGGLDDLIARSADPFASDRHPNGDGELFSILPSHSILPSPQGPTSRPGSLSGHGDLAEDGKYQSLTGALSQTDYEDDEDDDAGSIFSNSFAAAANAATIRPFSPSASSAGWGNLATDREQSTRGSDIVPQNIPEHADEDVVSEHDVNRGWDAEDEREAATDIEEDKTEEPPQSVVE